MPGSRLPGIFYYMSRGITFNIISAHFGDSNRTRPRFHADRRSVKRLRISAHIITVSDRPSGTGRITRVPPGLNEQYIYPSYAAQSVTRRPKSAAA